MVAVGIDFGTSTTVVAVAKGTGVQVAPDRDGNEIIPSVVAILPTGKMIFGASARARRLIDPKNSLFAVKRILGRHSLSAEFKQFAKQYPVETESGADNIPRFVTRNGALTAAEVASFLLVHLRDYPLLKQLGIDAVTLGVPATFKDDQRQALRDAAARAGYADVELIEEPVAVANDYLRGDVVARDETVAIFDLGGGTFDLAILRSGPHDRQVLASGGDPYLGGEDIDSKLANTIADDVLASAHWDMRADEKSFQTLLFLCEQAKVRLSQCDETVINLAPVASTLRDKFVTVRRREFDPLVMSLVQRTFVVCDDVLRRAGVRPKAITRVFLVGGCAYLPIVREAVGSYFGKVPDVAGRPDQVVARGAAWAASSRKNSLA